MFLLFLVLASPDHTVVKPVAHFRTFEECTLGDAVLTKRYVDKLELPEGYSVEFICTQGALA